MNPSHRNSAGFLTAESWASSANETPFFTNTRGDENPYSIVMVDLVSVIVAMLRYA